MDCNVRRRSLFCEGWLFLKGDPDGAQNPAFDDAGWRPLALPHDWSIEGPFDEHAAGGSGGAYLPAGIGWYRKRFYVAEEEQGKKVSVEFDGVYKNCDVWINAKHLGLHPNGFTSFRYDISPHLNYGDAENVLAVRVDNSGQPDARFYTGSGINRNVWLTLTDAVHIAHCGTCVTTPIASEELAWVVIRTGLRNESPGERSVVLQVTVRDAQGKVVASDAGGKPPWTRCQSYSLGPGAEYEVIRRIRLDRPRLWSLEDPHSYSVHHELLEGGTVVDDYVTPFGIREIRFDAGDGFLLNGKRVKISGVCLHHNGGCLGSAVPVRVWERRLEMLKAMGCNGVRTSHYPPAPELLDLCDRMGFLVMDEAFDEWLEGKEEYGYHQHFAGWAEADLTSILRRDRNHPCIILWSLGNEVPEQTRLEGASVLKRLVDIAHREDPSRPVTVACDNIGASLPTTEQFLELLDVVGYNYVDRWGERAETYYEIDRQRYPQRRMIGTENVSVGGVRGDYSAESGTSSWWPPYRVRMLRAELLWKYTRSRDFVAGDFLWTGIDYLGEAQWPHRSSSSGVLDLCGFPKDGYYFYQSQWTEEPVLHLFPHWTWPGHEGEVIPVFCFTNCESVELLVNGRSWGEKSFTYAHYGFDTGKGWAEQSHVPPVLPTTADLHLAWDVPYEPGIVRAVGRRDGRVVCDREVVTAGGPVQVELTADREAIAADGRDVVHLTVRVLDRDGNLVPMADNLIEFAVEGEGRIIGVGNGNPASHEPFQASSRRTFNGLCLAIVQAATTPGAIEVTARAEGLAEGSVRIEARSDPSPSSLAAPCRRLPGGQLLETID
jgi:beta-galactosidase